MTDRLVDPNPPGHRAMKNSAIFSKGVTTISFVLDADQVAKANRWAIRHKCSRAGQYGSAGDKFSFTFCPTGIGDFVAVQCSCGAALDLTENL